MVDLDLKTGSSGTEHEKLIDSLAGQIKISGTVQNDIYTISYAGDNPKTAKDVVQALLTIFLEGSLGDKKQDSKKAIQFIDDQIKAYEEKLAAAENAVKEYKLKHLGLIPQQGGDYGSKLMEASENLNRARLELAEAEQAREAIKKQMFGDESSAKATAAPITNPDLDARIQALSKNLDNLRIQYTENHPDIVAAKRVIAQLEAKNAEEARQRKLTGDPGFNASPALQQMKVSLSDAEARVASLRVRVQEYASRVARLKEMSAAAPEIETQLAQLNRDYQVNKENYEKLVASREAAKLSGELTATTEMMTFRVIDPPATPLLPTGPNRPRLMSIAFGAALVAGIGMALLFNLIRPTFLTQGALHAATGLPILGSVSMNWTEAEKKQRKKSNYIFWGSLLLLVLLYGAVMVRVLSKT
jgi:polysaccharide chain length determinant protein (PEP-CTERM system associated)